MNHLAPRQGKFAIVLLISFCLHFLMLTFSSEKSQYEQRTQKGEKIVEQLAKEAMVGITSQDRISLSVLAPCTIKQGIAAPPRNLPPLAKPSMIF